MQLKPTAERDVVPGVSACLFGRDTGSWRTKDLGARARAARFLADKGVTSVYAISASTFNAKIASVMQFREIKQISRGVAFFYGPLADGIENLHPKAACWIGSADCPTVVLTDVPSGGARVVVFHAGLQSLVGKKDGVWVSRKDRPSVVDNAMAAFPPFHREVHAGVFCGTHWLSYGLDHPVYAASNRQLHDLLRQEYARDGLLVADADGRVYLQNILLAQLLSCGVSIDQVHSDGFNTLTDRTSPDGGRLWWSRAKGDSGRNGVFIVRQF